MTMLIIREVFTTTHLALAPALDPSDDWTKVRMWKCHNGNNLNDLLFSLAGTQRVAFQRVAPPISQSA